MGTGVVAGHLGGLFFPFSQATVPEGEGGGQEGEGEVGMESGSVPGLAGPPGPCQLRWISWSMWGESEQGREWLPNDAGLSGFPARRRSAPHSLVQPGSLRYLSDLWASRGCTQRLSVSLAGAFLGSLVWPPAGGDRNEGATRVSGKTMHQGPASRPSLLAGLQLAAWAWQ